MKPRLWCIINTDWPTLFCALAVVLICLLGWFWPDWSPASGVDQGQLMVLLLFAIIVAASVFVWRVVRIYRLFHVGKPAMAVIVLLQLSRKRGRVEFMYEWQGDIYRSWTPVHETSAVRALAIGQQVAVLILPTKPQVAIIAHLYQS